MTKWCIYMRDNKVVSDIFECNPVVIENGSSLIVQVAEDRTILENTIKFFAHTRKKLTKEIIDQLKEYREKNQWLKIAATVREHTGENLCCKGQIDQFLSAL